MTRAEFDIGTRLHHPGLAALVSQMGSGPEVDPGTVLKDPRATAAISAAYQRLPVHDPAAVPAFRAMHNEVGRQFDRLQGMGINVEVTEHDPYDGLAAMIHDLRENNRLRVMSTASTGGHPFFGNDGNDMFRAVHDAFGHAATGRGFDRHGEEAAYLAHARTFSPLARRALATETRGQNSVVVTTGSFPEQKVGLLPATFSGVTPITGRRSTFRAAAAQARAYHTTQGLSL